MMTSLNWQRVDLFRTSRELPMVRRNFQAACLGIVLLSGLVAAPSVQACPMCKAALENNEDPAVAARPKAYMYSILFMLSMPATLATLFGVSFYRLSRQQQAVNDVLMAEYLENHYDGQDEDFSA
ncbi:hypothetical protein SH661x_003101 [Planctomicrobium sp. SH661]|uniref:hypothetical protein n=1 Tax=Planctomicrobium sp. SH661 TaxID=3448124 RepID=UPI003F5C8042